MIRICDETSELAYRRRLRAVNNRSGRGDRQSRQEWKHGPTLRCEEETARSGEAPRNAIRHSAGNRHSQDGHALDGGTTAGIHPDRLSARYAERACKGRTAEAAAAVDRILLRSRRATHPAPPCQSRTRARYY